MNNLIKVKDKIKELRLKLRREKAALKKAEKDYTKKIDDYGWNVSPIQMHNNINTFLRSEKNVIKNHKEEIENYEEIINSLTKQVKDAKRKIKDTKNG